MAEVLTVVETRKLIALAAVATGWRAATLDRATGSNATPPPPALLLERGGVVLLVHVTSDDAARKPLAAGPAGWAAGFGDRAEFVWVTPNTAAGFLYRLLGPGTPTPSEGGCAAPGASEPALHGSPVR